VAEVTDETPAKKKARLRREQKLQEERLAEIQDNLVIDKHGKAHQAPAGKSIVD
jgi:hypothetical protein